MLNVFDKLESQGVQGDAAVAEAEKRLMITQVPKTTAADHGPVRRREPGPAAGLSPHLTFYRIDRAGQVVERPAPST